MVTLTIVIAAFMLVLIVDKLLRMAADAVERNTKP